MFGFFTGTPVTLYSLEEKHYLPRWLSRDNADSFIRGMRDVALYDSLADFCDQRKPERVCLFRTYALGDILMLVPIIRALRRELALPRSVLLVIEDRFFNQIGGMNGIQDDIELLPSRGWCDYNADVHMNLNSCLESDHAGGADSDLHRLTLYGRALGVDVRRAS